MKNKSILIITIILMSIGFAAISTTLIINGNAKVSENQDDFSVIFTAATLDGKDVYSSVVDETKKIITFETSELKTLNQTSILEYTITNNSSIYDAEVKVTCVPKDGATAKYTSIKNELEGDADVVKAKKSVNGTLTTTLNKTSTEEVSEEYVCSLEFNGVERNELGYDGPTEWTFDYTGSEQIFTAPVTGTFKLETWGAQGGVSTSSKTGGFGSYSTGKITLQKGSKSYINIGGAGSGNGKHEAFKGGYNGGGDANIDSDVNIRTASGGGATHIASKSGILSTLSKKLSSIYVVASGGGGGGSNIRVMACSGGNGGGIQGGNGDSYKEGTTTLYGVGASQTSGGNFYDSRGNTNPVYHSIGSFGQAATCAGGGGGGGLYGGGCSAYSAGGGSGYIGNSLLTEKSMYCYNCTESTEESTKTISTTCTSATPTENCAKSGNGYARITLISY